MTEKDDEERTRKMKLKRGKQRKRKVRVIWSPTFLVRCSIGSGPLIDFSYRTLCTARSPNRDASSEAGAFLRDQTKTQPLTILPSSWATSQEDCDIIEHGSRVPTHGRLKRPSFTALGVMEASIRPHFFNHGRPEVWWVKSIPESSSASDLFPV